jgi:hypothetical protein
MTSIIRVQKNRPNAANIYQLPATRDWMDESHGKHAYMCFPMALTNRLGWGISFPGDIRFVWDGVDDVSPDHVTILEGHEWVHTNRSNATISFQTGLIFKTDADVTTLTMPVPNQFIPGTQCFTTLISTSFYMPELPVAWKIMEANKEILIPAGTPIAAVLPISLGQLESGYEMQITDEPPTEEYWTEVKTYGEKAQEKNAVGDWSKMYRDAIDYRGDTVGAHETKSIKLKTVTCPFTGQSYEVEDAHESDHSDN